MTDEPNPFAVVRSGTVRLAVTFDGSMGYIHVPHPDEQAWDVNWTGDDTTLVLDVTVTGRLAGIETFGLPVQRVFDERTYRYTPKKATFMVSEYPGGSFVLSIPGSIEARVVELDDGGVTPPIRIGLDKHGTVAAIQFTPAQVSPELRAAIIWSDT